MASKCFSIIPWNNIYHPLIQYIFISVSSKKHFPTITPSLINHAEWKIRRKYDRRKHRYFILQPVIVCKIQIPLKNMRANTCSMGMHAVSFRLSRCNAQKEFKAMPATSVVSDRQRVHRQWGQQQSQYSALRSRRIALPGSLACRFTWKNKPRQPHLPAQPGVSVCACSCATRHTPGSGRDDGLRPAPAGAPVLPTGFVPD